MIPESVGATVIYVLRILPTADACGDGRRTREPLTIHGDVPLNAGLLFACVIALPSGAVGVLHVLDIDS